MTLCSVAENTQHKLASVAPHIDLTPAASSYIISVHIVLHFVLLVGKFVKDKEIYGPHCLSLRLTVGLCPSLCLCLSSKLREREEKSRDMVEQLENMKTELEESRSRSDKGTHSLPSPFTSAPLITNPM